MKVPYTLPTRFFITLVGAYLRPPNSTINPNKLQAFKNYFFDSSKEQTSFEVDQDSVFVEYDMDAVGNFTSDPIYTSTDKKIDLFTNYYLASNPTLNIKDLRSYIIPDSSDLRSYLNSLPKPNTPIPYTPNNSTEYIKAIPNDHLPYYAAGAALVLYLLFSKSKKKKRKN